MDNLLKRLSTNQGKPPSRSMSIASSVDDLDENTENNENNSENNNSDESNVVRLVNLMVNLFIKK